MRYKINSTGRTIIADQAFMDAKFAGDYTTLPDAPIDRKDVILARLNEIDKQASKPRTMRELMINRAAVVAWVISLDNEAIALRTELAGL